MIAVCETTTSGDEANGANASRAAPAVRVGQPALCVDGRAGRVVNIMLDPSGQLRQVIVHLGWFWGREVSVPADWIQAIDRMGVHLAVDRRRLQALPDYRPDREIAIEGRIALREASMLDGADDGDITVTVCDGAAVLSGHVVGSRDKARAAQAMLTAGGVASVRNDLVTDEDLVNLVAQALGDDQRTRNERIFVAANHGMVTLSGIENRAHARADAEEIASSVPTVRGVCNYIKRPGDGVDDRTERALQPRIGQEVFASDMALGRVEQVIIDPHSRRVEDMVVYGQLPDRQRATPRMRSYDMPLEERRLLIPIAEVSSMTPTVMQLSVSGLAAARRDDFAPGDFRQPDHAWRPPYPYVANEFLWTKR
jgi:osmotically-inducible protein OsmY/sporulation protein YlmC with PRC-barrel domain